VYTRNLRLPHFKGLFPFSAAGKSASDGGQEQRFTAGHVL
jgi:hypothetical protein